MAEETKTEDKLYAGAEGEEKETPEKKDAETQPEKKEEKKEESKQTEPSKEKTSAPPEKKEEKKSGPPEKYELKLPEGSLLGPDAVEKVSQFAKERGLSNDEAQAMLDRDNALLASYAGKQQEEFQGMRQKWYDAAKDDKEIGGVEFGKNAELAKRVVDRYGNKELKEGLNATGFGNHPELVRFLVKIGKSMTEDQLVIPGTQSAEKPKDMAELFYGGSDQNKQ